MVFSLSLAVWRGFYAGQGAGTLKRSQLVCSRGRPLQELYTYFVAPLFLFRVYVVGCSRAALPSALRTAAAASAMDAKENLGSHETAWHAEGDLDTVLKHLGTSLTGLSNEDAKQRLAKFGRNALTPPPKPSFWRRLWNQVNT